MVDTKDGPIFFLESLESALVEEGAVVGPQDATLERAREACQLLEAEVDELRKELAEHGSRLDRRLDIMLHLRPELWGSPEAYELQVLLLLELRFVSSNASGITERYSAFLRPSFPNIGCGMLSSLTDDFSVLSETLSAFRSILAAEVLRDRLTPDPNHVA